MAVTIKSPNAPAADASKKESAPNTKEGPAQQQSAPAGANWMMKGQQAQKAMEQEEEKVKSSGQFQPFRFRLQQGEDASITFLDGDLDEHGFFENLSFVEHTAQRNGTWDNYPCLGEEEGCPLCELAKNKENKVSWGSQVFLFTVIDHRKTQGKNNKVYENEVRLLVAKRKTMAMLMKFANNQGGLAGVTMDVSRSSDNNSPAVGDIWMVQQKNTIKDIQESFQTADKKIEPLDY
ncbi:MAG: hypothetical protein OEX12_13965, partial [Gammaproteobacteria bacterium]|nr:hypothetical protein [Gammaproteobacteria bacterium]